MVLMVTGGRVSSTSSPCTLNSVNTTCSITITITEITSSSARHLVISRGQVRQPELGPAMKISWGSLLPNLQPMPLPTDRVSKSMALPSLPPSYSPRAAATHINRGTTCRWHYLDTVHCMYRWCDLAELHAGAGVARSASVLCGVILTAATRRLLGISPLHQPRPGPLSGNCSKSALTAHQLGWWPKLGTKINFSSSQIRVHFTVKLTVLAIIVQ